MPSIRHLLCALLAVGVLFSSTSAEARFGKRSSSSESSEKKSKSHSASPASDDDGDDAPRSRRRSNSSSSGAAFLVDLLFHLIVETAPAVAYVEPVPPPPPATVSELPPEAVAPPPPEVVTTRSPSQPSPVSVRLGVDGAAMNTVAGLGAFLGIEGKRGGMDARALGLILPTDDGTSSTDNITLLNVHATYSLVSQERIRLRVEGGISTAHAPDLTALGPSIALSLDACLGGNLDLELRAQSTPFPYRQVDALAGLALHLNALMVRGGWRALYLNDMGVVDDVVHEEAFGGPYVGLGFAF